MKRFLEPLFSTAVNLLKNQEKLIEGKNIDNKVIGIKKTYNPI